MNEFDRQVVDVLRPIVAVVEVSSDVIPGPPPDFRKFLLINCEIPSEILSRTPKEILQLGRQSAAAVVRLTANSKHVTREAEGVCIQLVKSALESPPMRVYSATVLFDAIHRRSLAWDASDLPAFCINEFSMLSSVSALFDSVQ